MATKQDKLKARLPRGLADRGVAEIRATEAMLARIREVYDRYGFEPVETPLIEYTDALGKFLPDQDRPNEGVFSFQDDDEQWLSLRYDLTAPLARHVAENFDRLPKPYRSYRSGWVFRNEKPGPGRFRQFMQFDADTVGAASPAADAEMCMMMADTLKELGLKPGQYVVKVNSRKILDGVMEAIGLAGEENAGRRLAVLRAIDKLDRLGVDGVRELLGPGRKDESGDFTKGAGLSEDQVHEIITLVQSTAAVAESRDLLESWELDDSSYRAGFPTMGSAGLEFVLLTTSDPSVANSNDWSPVTNAATIKKLRGHFGGFGKIKEGLDELEQIAELVRAARYGSRRIRIDPSVVRGLEYYTGPVFEAELLFETVNDKGEPARFGSVGGGGRYDGLVGRFRGEDVPATGFSIGVSRLMAALSALGKADLAEPSGPVVVTIMEKDRIADYQRLAASLRSAGIAAELYLGGSGMKAQLKYADRRNAPCVVIQGSDERARGVVQVKDLAAGKALAVAISDNATWREERPGQFEVAESQIVAAVREILARRTGGA